MTLPDLVTVVYAAASWLNERKQVVVVRRLVADGVVVDLGRFADARRFHIHHRFYKPCRRAGGIDTEYTWRAQPSYASSADDAAASSARSPPSLNRCP